MIAIDYPPFTSEKEQDSGTAFSLLNDALKGSRLTILPQYWSPARANKLVRGKGWCASFYPPRKQDDNLVIIGLGSEPIRLGLYRHRKQSRFYWDELSEMKGKKVAYLRALARDGIGQQMTDAGMVIFDIETIQQGLQLLERKRVDYAFGDQVSGPMIMRSLKMDLGEFQFSETSFRKLPAGIWLNLQCKSASTAYEYLMQKGVKALVIQD